LFHGRLPLSGDLAGPQPNERGQSRITQVEEAA
jgi:hypothetical protein